MGRRGGALAAALAALAALAAAPGGAWAFRNVPAECPRLKARGCRRSVHCVWSGKACAAAGDSGEAKCAAVQVKERRKRRRRRRGRKKRSRKRALCEMLKPAGGACVCSNQEGGLCGTCTYQSNEPTPPVPGGTGGPKGPCPESLDGALRRHHDGACGEWIAAWATNYGDYNKHHGREVACSDCPGWEAGDNCQGIHKVGKTPCVTAVGGADWNNPVCRKAGCYAIRCTGPKTVQPTCSDDNAVIIVQVVDGCAECDPPGTGGYVFDMSNQPFFEITQGGEGPIFIEYQEVSCDKMPPLGRDQSCKITL